MIAVSHMPAEQEAATGLVRVIRRLSRYLTEECVIRERLVQPWYVSGKLRRQRVRLVVHVDHRDIGKVLAVSGRRIAPRPPQAE